MHVLLLGGYGFIGREIARELQAAGHSITGVGRSAALGERLCPQARWVGCDIATLDTQDGWLDLLEGIDVVVNAAGALQSGLKDDVDAIHDRAISALVRACETCGVNRFVQVSAVGARPDAATAFMRSKARGDATLRASRLDWVLLRPGLVIGANAFGGTALLRMAAAMPLVLPVVFGDRRVQTVALTDLARIVREGVEGTLPARTECDIVEARTHTLREVLMVMREWLGLHHAWMTIDVPVWLARAMAVIADGLGYLGWRSPLRSTALQVLAGDIVGDARSYPAITRRELVSFEETLASLPSTVQERWFAKLYRLLPLIVVVLSIFWILSGVIALRNLDTAIAQSGMTGVAARWLVVVASFIDVCLGTAILVRAWARLASQGMILVGLGYLALGSLLRPELWSDPLGPLLKILPATVLAIVASALLDDGR